MEAHAPAHYTPPLEDLHDIFTLDQATELASRLGRGWKLLEPFGPSGWLFTHDRAPASILVSLGKTPDGREWFHASFGHRNRMPSYDELQMLHRAVWPEGWSYQVFAPPADHVNIHQHALHLWGLSDGTAILPNFGADGTI